MVVHFLTHLLVSGPRLKHGRSRLRRRRLYHHRPLRLRTRTGVGRRKSAPEGQERWLHRLVRARSCAKDEHLFVGALAHGPRCMAWSHRKWEGLLGPCEHPRDCLKRRASHLEWA